MTIRFGDILGSLAARDLRATAAAQRARRIVESAVAISAMAATPAWQRLLVTLRLDTLDGAASQALLNECRCVHDIAIKIPRDEL